MEPAKYAEIFLEESREHLTAVNQHLLTWERTPDASEPLAAIFRSVHDIKGGAATMGYPEVAELAHRAESLLAILRSRGGRAEAHLLDLLFRAADGLGRLVEGSVRGTVSHGDGGDLVEALAAAAAGLAPAGDGEAPRPSVPEVPAPAPGGRGLRIVLRPDTPLPGARALIVLRELGGLGPVSGVEPAPAHLESEGFDGRFACRIDTEASDEAIHAAVRRVADVEAVEIARVAAAETPAARKVAATRHLRVDLRRLDALMNLVGEMSAARFRLEELSARRVDPDLEDLVVRISHLTRALQAEVIEARMTPGWQVFDRFPRLVRDVARRLGKRVAFHVEGRDIELDRAILDELGDPLAHLLRNAIDHGIEPPHERRDAGKPAEARLELTAARERGAVVIRVADDGRGIDRAAVLRDAKAEGIVPADTAALGDDALLDVLARPGYTTAAAVSEVSGRGVGIDAVRTRLRGLGGSLELTTREGAGTTFTLRLPPTLAIVPALLAEVDAEQYALPLTHVEETVEWDAGAVTEMEGAESMVVRGEVVPLVHLRRLVELDGQGPAGRPVIIVQIGNRRSGLVVDRVAGQREIVVKGFEPPVGTAPIFGGATILGDGRAVFVLDAARLV